MGGNQPKQNYQGAGVPCSTGVRVVPPKQSGMGYKRLLAMMKAALNTEDYPYKQTTLAKRVREVGAKGIDVDTASPFFIAQIYPKPLEVQLEIEAAQTLDALKHQLTDTATGAAITGPGGVKLTVAVSRGWHLTA